MKTCRNYVPSITSDLSRASQVKSRLSSCLKVQSINVKLCSCSFCVGFTKQTREQIDWKWSQPTGHMRQTLQLLVTEKRVLKFQWSLNTLVLFQAVHLRVTGDDDRIEWQMFRRRCKQERIGSKRTEIAAQMRRGLSPRLTWPNNQQTVQIVALWRNVMSSTVVFGLFNSFIVTTRY